VSAPVGRREFFALEAGEYLERLSLLVTGLGAPEPDELVRHARALRGAALLAGPPGYAAAAAALENVAKSLRDGALPWTPLLADRAADAIETCKALLRKVREWSDTDVQRCERLAEKLDGLVGAVGRRPPGGPEGGALTAGVRAYVARESAAVAGTLEQVADAVEREPAAESAAPVIRRLQPLRGLGALPGLSPLPELLEALDLTLAFASRGGAWPPAAGRALRATAMALGRMARDIAELGMPQPDSSEVVQATVLLRATFLDEADVVPVATLFPTGDSDAVVRRGTPPAPAPVAGGITAELVGLADRLRDAAEQSTGVTGGPARALQRHALALGLRGLGMSPSVHAALGGFLGRLDRLLVGGGAEAPGEEYAAVLRTAAAALAKAAEAGSPVGLAATLAPLGEALERLAGQPVTAAEPALVPVESLAPDEEADIVPIETLLLRPAAVLAPALLPFEQSFSTYFRLMQVSPEWEAVPIDTLAPEADAVPIEALFYRGRRALERANVLHRELDAALRTRHGFTGVEALLAELLDLVPLALDDDR
jgi:HPt (histidine-containing phosphotransfer) domain-containing protein